MDPPWELSEEAAEIWRRLAPELGRAGVLTPWDLDTFVRYCEVVVVAREAHRTLRGSALLLKGRRDPVVTNPAWRLYRDAVALQRVLAQEFGLTPSARSGLHLVDGTSPSPLRNATDAMSSDAEGGRRDSLPG